jgi:phosphohistidine phosphatase SixA
MLLRVAACCVILALGLPVQGAETIWLVRHAEQIDPEAKDPELTAAGREMAVRLAKMLGEAGIRTIYSSDYHRTRQTAAPLAEQLGIELTIYDPGKLETLAEELQSVAGPCLVVGHSNTTPRLVQLLGGDPAGAIDHLEFNRLYLVDLGGERPGSILLRIP